MDTKAPPRVDRTTVAERQEVAMRKAAGESNRSIAKSMKRSRPTIATILKSEEVQRLKVQARDLIDRSQVNLAEDYLGAVKVGAAKGKWEGAFHGLVSLGVIPRGDGAPTGPSTIVNIGQVIVEGNPSKGLPERQVIIEGVTVPDVPDDDGTTN